MIRLRFFARFRELLGPEISVEAPVGTSILDLLREVTHGHSEGRKAIFDANGRVRKYVILMRNGTRVDLSRAETTPVEDGDEIAVFPPVAGG